MKHKFVCTLFIVFMSMALSGCSTKVKRVDPAQPIDLSGGWNDYDARLVAQEMIEDSLSRPWLDQFQKANGRDPMVIVGKVFNQTNEHLNTGVFTKQLERELTNSGKVIFVASPIERDQIRDERQDQQRGFTDQSTIKAFGREKGADYMLIGTVSSVVDQVKNRAAVFYQVNLELVDLATNVKVWIGQKQIKKDVTRPKVTY